MPDVDEWSIGEEDKFRRILLYVLAIAFAFVGLMIASQFLLAGESTAHPPQVLITRTGENISVVYNGGIDDGFVGDFRITWINKYGITQTDDFVKPKYPGDIVGEIPAPPTVACVTVHAIDKAVQSYRAIGYACV